MYNENNKHSLDMEEKIYTFTMKTNTTTFDKKPKKPKLGLFGVILCLLIIFYVYVILLPIIALLAMFYGIKDKFIKPKNLNINTQNWAIMAQHGDDMLVRYTNW